MHYCIWMGDLLDEEEYLMRRLHVQLNQIASHQQGQAEQGHTRSAKLYFPPITMPREAPIDKS